MSNTDDFSDITASSKLRKNSKLVKQSTGNDFDFTHEKPTLGHITAITEDENTTTNKHIRFDKQTNSETDDSNRPLYNNNKKVKPIYHNSPIDFYRLKLSKSKLKAVTRTSALLSGFAMVAMVELGLDYSSLTDYSLNEISNGPRLFRNAANLTTKNITETNVFIPSASLNNNENRFKIPQSILILYALVTCLLVGVHMLALMISTCILPQIEALSLENEHFWPRYDINETLNHTQNQTATIFHEGTDESIASFNKRIELSRSSYHPVGYDSILNDSQIMFPYIQYHRFIEMAWISSTVIGIFLFLVEIGLVCYIKFYPISQFAALAGAIVMAPILILFVVFTVTFYKRLAGFKVNLTKKVLSQVDRNLIPLKTNIV
jgi:calcium release-activated calcium channel protein 1